VKRFVLLFLGLIAAIAMFWAATTAAVVMAGARPVLRQADAILVLGAAQYNGRPSPVLKARLDHAIDLYDQGWAPRVIFTGGVGAGDTLSEGEVARRYAIENGVPDSVILVDRQGATSAASVDAAGVLMNANGLHSALLVSDSYHMLRLELLARRAGIRPYRAPTPASPIDLDRATYRRYVLRESLLLPAQAILRGR
jgi:uncharacterized SAM-binding protein YcdF (DUF218 family)